MSLYNMMNGVQPETFIFLPMLGKHPDQYPRFRDCVIGRMVNSDKNDQFGIPVKRKEFTKGKREISVYTRVGGENRESYEKEIQELRNTPGYVTDYDDDFDTTFATFVFEVPKKWEKDYDTIRQEGLMAASEEYKREVERVYPRLRTKLPWNVKEEEDAKRPEQNDKQPTTQPSNVE